MDHIEESYTLLFPEQAFSYTPVLKYSGKFKPYNANVRLAGNTLTFNLAKEWREVSREIQIGLIQDLMLRLFKAKKQSMYVDLYHKFVQKLHIAMPKTKSDPVLATSFSRLNEAYFFGTMEQPNLVWGMESKRKLGSYEFKTDTITISTVFHDFESVFLDYVMYHEMLHKKFQYKSNFGRSRFHTAEFRKREAVFPDAARLELELKKLLYRYDRRKRFSILSLIGLD